MLANPDKEKITIKQLATADKNTVVEIVNGKRPIPVKWVAQGNDVKIVFPKNNLIPVEHPLVVKFTPAPS